MKKETECVGLIVIGKWRICAKLSFNTLHMEIHDQNQKAKHEIDKKERRRRVERSKEKNREENLRANCDMYFIYVVPSTCESLFALSLSLCTALIYRRRYH